MVTTRDQKRKAPEELSKNPNTIKSRKRLEGMDEIEYQVEQAKRNDTSAVTYQINKKLRVSKEYKMATKQEQLEMEAKVKDEVHHKRYVI